VSTGSVISIVLTLALVLGIMGIALKFLRKYTIGNSSRSGNIPMEVVQRLTLGQRQGIAVVRIGTRTLAVSMGDGGVRYLAELQSDELTETVQEQQTVKPASVQVNNASSHRISYVAPLEDFQAVLSMAMNGPARS
jgi:flagellar biogenesis protein FliO